MRAAVSLLVGSVTLGWTTLPDARDVRWTHGQHGPASASFSVPCRPFGALDGRLRRDARLFIVRGSRCVWSGYLLPISSAQSDGEFVTVAAAGTFERGKHDESYVRTFTDSDESKWILRKGSSQRLTIENDSTLVLRAEGGGTDQPTNWRVGLHSELVYFLDDGLGDPSDLITLLEFIYNCDLTTSWLAYVDAYTDLAAVAPISRIWSFDATGSGSAAISCPGGARALAFGLRVAATNQLQNDVFAELSDVYVTASSGRVRIDEALGLVAADLTAGTITTEAVGSDLEHLVWPFGSGSRSYSQESIVSLHNEKVDWRYVPPASAPGEDSFIARPMPTAPDNRQRWWFVSAKDPGVTVDLTYQDPESMDVAAILYTSKGGSRTLVPIPNPETTDWPATWDRSAANATITDTAYGGWVFSPLGFLLTSDPTERAPRIGYVDDSGFGVPVIAGAEYRVTADVERVTTFWPTGSSEWPGITLKVLWYTAAHAFISTTVIDWVAGVGGGESGQEIVSRGDKFTLGSFNGNPVTAPAAAAFGKLDVQFTGADGGSGQVAVSNCHLDSLVASGSKLASAYHPAAPISVDQRVRVFDYTSEELTDTAAESVLHQAYAWYGVSDSERDREPVGTIGVQGSIQTVDGAVGEIGQMQTGDWITVVDDIEHVAWPQFIVGVEVTDDGESASVQLGGDGGDFNYIGRAVPPELQKRKRRAGHHRRVLWKVWAMKNARAAFKKQHKYKTFSAYMKANPLPKKHPKWAPG